MAHSVAAFLLCAFGFVICLPFFLAIADEVAFDTGRVRVGAREMSIWGPTPVTSSKQRRTVCVVVSPGSASETRLVLMPLAGPEYVDALAASIGAWIGPSSTDGQGRARDTEAPDPGVWLHPWSIAPWSAVRLNMVAGAICIASSAGSFLLLDGEARRVVHLLDRHLGLSLSAATPWLLMGLSPWVGVWLAGLLARWGGRRREVLLSGEGSIAPHQAAMRWIRRRRGSADGLTHLPSHVQSMARASRVVPSRITITDVGTGVTLRFAFRVGFSLLACAAALVADTILVIFPVPLMLIALPI